MRVSIAENTYLCKVMAATSILSRSAGVSGGGGALWLVMLLTMKPIKRLMMMRLYSIHKSVWILPNRVFGTVIVVVVD